MAEAHARCFMGKGIARHSSNLDPFSKHDFWDYFHQAGFGFAHGQVLKKLKEYTRTGDILELLDCIVYITAAIMWEEHQRESS